MIWVKCIKAQSNMSNISGTMKVSYNSLDESNMFGSQRPYDTPSAITRSIMSVIYRPHLIQKNCLTHCSFVAPYDKMDLDQHWLRWWLAAWRYQAITWTNVDLSLVRSVAIKSNFTMGAHATILYNYSEIIISKLLLWGGNNTYMWQEYIGLDNGLAPDRCQAII